MTSASQSYSTHFLNSSNSHYSPQNGRKSPEISGTKMQPLHSDEVDQVRLHPLIIAKDTVVCMPEVNKVLRTVYQVLSQANYYLSKHGISSRRFSGAQLIKIKMLGILNHDAKVCSYILQHEAERIFDSFDLSGSSRKSQKMIWMDPVLLDEKAHDGSSGGKHSSSGHSKHLGANPVDIQTFSLSEETIVCAPDIQKVIQTHFNQGATTGYYFSKLGIVPFKFIHSAHLDKVKELGIIKKSAVHCTYVSTHDAKRVFEAYGMTEEDLKTKINWLPAVSLDDLSWRSKWPQSAVKSEVKSEGAYSPANDCSNEDDNHHKSNGNNMDHPGDDSALKPGDPLPSKVHIFIVENNEVVCMPDIHKVVQAVHGSSIQVNYYLNKLHVKKKRFCFAHLKELKNRGVLQGNATYCTYIPKMEAEKIFQIYSLMGDQRLNGIEWTEPLRLDKLLESGITTSEKNGDGTYTTGDGHVFRGLNVPVFLVDNEEVLCTPDVHKIVDYLEEQSASLDYHFRKLGIIKRRYTYSQLHQLRRLQIIKRPTVCTYIRKIDVEQLLLMYATDRNKIKMQNIEWLKAVPLLSSEHGPQRNTESPKSDVNNAGNDQVLPAESPDADYGVSDLYKIYVGDKPNHEQERYSNSPETPLSHKQSKQSRACPISASAELQKANPHIDCPIVIPNADFDPSISSSSMNVPTLSSPGHYHGYGHSYENTARGSYTCLKRKFNDSTLEEGGAGRRTEDEYSILEKLLKDLHRKETELRFLHDAYQHEIRVEKERRIQAEKELDRVRDQLLIEQEHRERIENDNSYEDGHNIDQRVK